MHWTIELINFSPLVMHCGAKSLTTKSMFEMEFRRGWHLICCNHYIAWSHETYYNILLSLCPVGLKLALLQKSIFAEIWYIYIYIYISYHIYIYIYMTFMQPHNQANILLHFSFCIMVCEQQEFQCLIVVLGSISLFISTVE